MNEHLIVRAGALYLPIALLLAVVAIRRPDRQSLTGALLAFSMCLPTLLLLNVIAIDAGWWSFDAEGGLLIGFPVDLWLAWALLWGPIPSIAFPRAPLAVVVLAALAFDLVLMPAGAPVIALGEAWLSGEALGFVMCLVPAQLLARWTSDDRRLNGRALLQVAAFSGIAGFLLPAIAIDASGSTWINPVTYPRWMLSVLVQVMAVPALIGFSAVQEFATRGQGTPVPYDPPRRLVSTGIYAYVANPMQLSAVVLLILLGVVLQNPWVAAAGIVAHVYSVGIAGWDEDSDLRARFGDGWHRYRQRVRQWVPRWRPWYHAAEPNAVLYVSEECGMCREVAAWYRQRDVRGLTIVAAEDHPSKTLTRITYESRAGSYEASGMVAVARALEHVHFGWAMIGFAIRMPIVSAFVQLVADASGAEPRPVTTRNRASRLSHRHYRQSG